MKKAKNIKFLVLILTLALVISSMVLVVASANTEDAPSIVAVNLSLEGDNRIAIAVDASTASENVKVVASADGVDAQEFGYYAKETINFGGTSKECYLFLTPYIGQKDLGKVYSFQAVDGEKESKVATMSVAEYFYLRLFRDGVVEATEGEALAQKTLYIANLNAGAAAENLFYNFDEDDTNNIAVLANAYNIALIPGTDPVVYKNNTTTVTLPAYAGTIPEGKVFAGYAVTKYDADYAATVTTANAGEQITIDANTVVGATFKDEFNAGEGKYYSNIAYSGQRFEYSSLGANGNFKYDGANKNKTEVVNNVLEYTSLAAGSDYIRWNYDAKPADVNKFVFETDFMFDNITSTGEHIFKILIQCNGIEQGYYTTSSDYADNKEIETLNIGDMTLNAATWYNIRFELDYTANTVSLYLNGKFVSENAISTTGNSNSRILWYYQSGVTSGTMSYDNTFVGWVEEPVTPADFAAGNGEYYTNGSFTKYDGSSTSGIASGNREANQAISFGNVTEGENSVLHANVNAANSNNSQAYLQWNSTMTDPATQKFVFESDFKFENFDTSRTDLGFLRFRFNNQYVEAKVNTITTENVKIISIGKMILTAGEWYNIRFEVDMATGTVEYFVNGTNVGSETLALNNSTSSQNRFLWYNENGVSVDMYFDNFCYGMATK